MCFEVRQEICQIESVRVSTDQQVVVENSEARDECSVLG